MEICQVQLGQATFICGDLSSTTLVRQHSFVEICQAQLWLGNIHLWGLVKYNFGQATFFCRELSVTTLVRQHSFVENCQVPYNFGQAAFFCRELSGTVQLWSGNILL